MCVWLAGEASLKSTDLTNLRGALSCNIHMFYSFRWVEINFSYVL